MITDGLNPFTVLLFVGAALAGVTLIVLYAIARAAKREPLARITLRLLLGGAGVYVVSFLVASLTSRNRVLAVGEEKHICEIDCHLAYAVAATKSEPLPNGQVRRTVTVKVRFDEETI
jgi:H+/Cl- antiporter ClcA